jgi:hypothetical protein
VASPFHDLLSDRSSWKILTVADKNAAAAPVLELVGGKKTDKAEKPDQAAKEPESKPRDLFELVAAAKPEILGPGMKQVQQATKDYLQDHDAAAYETKLGQAISQTDRDYGDTVAAKWGDLSLAKRDMQTKAIDFADKNQNLKGTVEALPEAKQNTVKALIGMVMQGDVSEELKQSMLKELKKYPDVSSSFERMRQSAQNLEKGAQALYKAQEPLLKAASEQAESRIVLAQLKQVNGDTGTAQILKQQAKEDYDKTTATIKGKPYEPKPSLQA